MRCTASGSTRLAESRSRARRTFGGHAGGPPLSGAVAGNPTPGSTGAQAVSVPRVNIFAKSPAPPRPAALGPQAVFDSASACAPADTVERPAAARYRRRRRAAPIFTWAALLAGLIALVVAWGQLRGAAPDRSARPAPQHHQPRARQPRPETTATRGSATQRRTRKGAKPHRATRPRRSTRRRLSPPPAVPPPGVAPSTPRQRATPTTHAPAPRRLPARVAPGAPPEFM